MKKSIAEQAQELAERAKKCGMMSKRMAELFVSELNDDPELGLTEIQLIRMRYTLKHWNVAVTDWIRLDIDSKMYDFRPGDEIQVWDFRGECTKLARITRNPMCRNEDGVWEVQVHFLDGARSYARWDDDNDQWELDEE